MGSASWPSLAVGEEECSRLLRTYLLKYEVNVTPGSPSLPEPSSADS